MFGYSIYFIERIFEGEEVISFFNKNLTKGYLEISLDKKIIKMKNQTNIQILDEDLKQVKIR